MDRLEGREQVRALELEFPREGKKQRLKREGEAWKSEQAGLELQPQKVEDLVYALSAVDATGHIIPSFAGTVSLTSTDVKATLPAAYKFTPADKGSHAFTVTLRSAGSRDIIAHFGALTGTGSQTVVAATATHLQVVAPINPTAGTPFDVIVKALDAFGNTASSYVGTVHVGISGPIAGVTLPSARVGSSAPARSAPLKRH